MSTIPSYKDIFRDLVWRLTSTKLLFAVLVIVLILIKRDMEVESIIGLLTAQGVFSVSNVISDKKYATSN